MTPEPEQQPTSTTAAHNGQPEQAPLPQPAGLFDRPPSRPPLPPPPRRSLSRSDLQRRARVDGAEVPDRLWVRLRRLWLQLVTSDREREEAELEARLRERRRVTRTNLAAVVSPKGGVGKTTAAS